MENQEGKLIIDSKDKVLQIFKDFLTRVAKIEELGAVGNRLLSGFQQGLESLRRPAINMESELMQSVIKANETGRLKSYIAAGCINTHDRIENMGKLQTCILGLHDHLNKAKSIICELQNLLEELTTVINSSKNVLHSKNEDLCEKLDQQATINQEEALASGHQGHEMTDYAGLIGIIYYMVKQDYVMQEKIVTSLSLKSPSGELESYCLMWSLRPYVNDEIMHKAWGLIS